MSQLLVPVLHREPTLDDAMAVLDRLNPAALQYINASSTWAPMPGPQLDAWNSPADELFFGGQAGGGKTDFVCGLALESHVVSVIYRHEYPQLTGITDRLARLLGGRDLFSGKDKVWRLGGRQIEYGSMPNPGDEEAQQGRPRDLIVFDEVTQFREYQYRYLQTWNRHADHVPPTQRCRVVATGNPPTSPEGLWVTQYWGPWLDKHHPLFGKVKPGELLWYITVGGKDCMVRDGGPQLHPDTGRWVQPRSRTFIPASIESNEFLMRTGYADSLDALPEPLRSQMRYGDFSAGQDDHERQVIPSEWVEAAQVRWKMRQHDPRGPLSALGVDPSRGGKDEFIITPRWGSFFGEQHTYPGTDARNGNQGAALVTRHMSTRCPINVDVVGIGTSVVDSLEGLGMDVHPLHGAASSYKLSKTGALEFLNLRAELYWRMRELLDPSNPDPIALPPSQTLKQDLCTPLYSTEGRKVKIESKESIKTRLGRSPDAGDSAVYAAHDYDNHGLMSQAMLSDEPQVTGAGYQRPHNQRDKRGDGSAWVSWGGTIQYPDDM